MACASLAEPTRARLAPGTSGNQSPRFFQGAPKIAGPAQLVGPNDVPPAGCFRDEDRQRPTFPSQVSYQRDESRRASAQEPCNNKAVIIGTGLTKLAYACRWLAHGWVGRLLEPSPNGRWREMVRCTKHRQNRQCGCDRRSRADGLNAGRMLNRATNVNV
jgi:hypothetical protein